MNPTWKFAIESIFPSNKSIWFVGVDNQNVNETLFTIHKQRHFNQLRSLNSMSLVRD